MSLRVLNIDTQKKIENQLTNFITYDRETHNTDRGRFYCIYFQRLSKLAANYNGDSIEEDTDKCKKDTLFLIRKVVLLNR